MTDSITCPRCQMTSRHPNDIEQGYCGNCHDFTSGTSSRLAFEEFLATGRMPMWRRQALEGKAVRDAVRDAVSDARESRKEGRG